MERLKELIDRMVAPGDAFAQLSASEGHEIREGCLSLIARVAELEAVALFALYNHQGSCSHVGQLIRKRLGIGRFYRLTADQIEKAEAIADAAGMGHE